MAADHQRQQQGVVIRFFHNKGYGFIKPDSSDKDLFVHQTEIQCKGYRSLHEGQEVRFSVSVKNGKKVAVNVTALDGSNIEHRRRNSGRDGRRDGGQRSGFRSGRWGFECYNCGGVGHLAWFCSSPVMVRRGGRECYKCGEEGHLAGDCTNVFIASGHTAKVPTCYNCGSEEHIARDCDDEYVGHFMDGHRDAA